MPKYAYRGRNTRGELVQGVIDDTGTGAVADQLLNNGISPVDITLESRQAPAAGTRRLVGNKGWFGRLLAESVTHEDVSLFSRQMHSLLRSGVPILRALAGLQDSATKASFAVVLGDIRNSLDSGRDISAALVRHPRAFSPFYVSMVRIGELTGALSEVFLQLFDHLEFERDISDRVKTALRYPAFVVAVMAIAMIVMNIFVIPAFVKMYSGFKADLPLMTQILIGFSSFMVHYWLVLVPVATGALLGTRFYVSTSRGRYHWDRIKLKIPLFGKIVLKATLARFSRSLAMALKSGVPAVQALSVVAQVVDNAYVAQRVEQMRDAVERGESIIRTAVTTGVFTPVVLQMLAVGEESGELEELLQEIADMYQRDVEYELKTLSSQIEPILIVVLGGFVLVLALGIFLPIWDLGQVALKK